MNPKQRIRMKNSLLSIIAISSFALVGCGEKKDGSADSEPKPESTTASKPNPAPKPSPEPAPNPEPAPKVTAESRDAFLGTWKGKYSGIDDEMIIEKGAGDDEVVITLHADFENPDKVNGKLVAADKIEVPKQSMGGAPGTAVITLADGKLHLAQSGFGLTVEGKDYEKQ